MGIGILRTFWFPNFLAWSLGVLPIKYPWSKSYVQVKPGGNRNYWIFAFLYNALKLIILFDFYAQGNNNNVSRLLFRNHGDGGNSTGTATAVHSDNKSLKTKFIEFYTAGQILVFGFHHFYILIKASKILQLYGAFEGYPYFKSDGDLKVPTKFTFIIWAGFVIRMITFVSYSATMMRGVESKYLFFFWAAPTWVKFVAYILIGHLSLSIINLIPFSLIIQLTCALVKMHEDLGQELEMKVHGAAAAVSTTNYDSNGVKVKPMPSPVTVEKVDENQPHRRQKLPIEPSLENLNSKFQKLQSSYKLYDDFVGPLLISILLFGMISLVNSLATLVTEKVQLIEGVHNGFLILMNSIVIMAILETGYWAHQKMEFQRSNLRALLLVHSNTNTNDWWTNTPQQDTRALISNSECRMQIDESTMQLYIDWDWKLSGCGFFVVDRPLLSSMLNSMLSYSVVLFQLSDDDIVSD